MEAYPGAVILATNFSATSTTRSCGGWTSSSTSRSRRPRTAAGIWQLVLPDAGAGRATTSSSTSSPRNSSCRAAAIRNCSLAAAFRAADEGSAIEMGHLVRGVAQEYAQAGTADARGGLRALPLARPAGATPVEPRPAGRRQLFFGGLNRVKSSAATSGDEHALLRRVGVLGPAREGRRCRAVAGRVVEARARGPRPGGPGAGWRCRRWLALGFSCRIWLGAVRRARLTRATSDSRLENAIQARLPGRDRTARGSSSGPPLRRRSGANLLAIARPVEQARAACGSSRPIQLDHPSETCRAERFRSPPAAAPAR